MENGKLVRMSLRAKRSNLKMRLLRRFAPRNTSWIASAAFGSLAMTRSRASSISLVLFFLVSLPLACAQKPQTDQPATQASPSLLKPNDLGPAADYELEDLEGNAVQLGALFKDKVVLLDFWATWCPPCREEIPGFVRLYEKHKDMGFEMVGIALDQAGPSAIKRFVDEFSVSYPILIGDSGVSKAYGGIRAIPTSFLISKEGRILKRYIGFQEEELFEEDILTALGGS